jgi:hypothetical protein
VQAWVELRHDELIADWALAAAGERPFRMNPCEAEMKNDLVSVKPRPDHKLMVELVDGRRGVVDVQPWLTAPGMARLRDLAYFSQVTILLGAATWPQGEDIAPDTLAEALQALQAV